jgi:hypothetical protein
MRLSHRMGWSYTASRRFDSVQPARRLRSMLAVQMERARDFAAIASATDARNCMQVFSGAGRIQAGKGAAKLARSKRSSFSP